MQHPCTRSGTWHTLGAALLAVAACGSLAGEPGDVQRLLKTGQAAEALRRAEQHLASHPDDAQMRFLRGVALAEQGRSSDAMAAFVKLTEDYPELPEPYNNLAVLYAGQGQYDKARTALEMAIRANPGYATAYENLGDVYARLASQAYARALQAEGGRPGVAPKLAQIQDLFSPSGTGTAHAATAEGTTPPGPTPAPVRPDAAARPASASTGKPGAGKRTGSTGTRKVENGRSSLKE